MYTQTVCKMLINGDKTLDTITIKNWFFPLFLFFIWFKTRFSIDFTRNRFSTLEQSDSSSCLSYISVVLKTIHENRRILNVLVIFCCCLCFFFAEPKILPWTVQVMHVWIVNEKKSVYWYFYFHRFILNTKERAIEKDDTKQHSKCTNCSGKK